MIVKNTPQKTVKNTIEMNGVGLHSGKKIKLLKACR